MPEVVSAVLKAEAKAWTLEAKAIRKLGLEAGATSLDWCRTDVL